MTGVETFDNTCFGLLMGQVIAVPTCLLRPLLLPLMAFAPVQTMLVREGVDIDDWSEE
jgi:hypothetical protein